MVVLTRSVCPSVHLPRVWRSFEREESAQFAEDAHKQMMTDKRGEAN